MTRAIALLALIVLLAAAWTRSAEYDEQYTLFLTAGTPRPAWPDTPFPATDVLAAQRMEGVDPIGIARDLRATDVHPPLYFWAVALWRTVFGDSLFVARLFSVACSFAALLLLAGIARRLAIAPALAMAFTVGAYGFVATGIAARGFALAQMLLLFGVWRLAAGRRSAILSGLAFGAAILTNYLAAFVAAAALAWLLAARGWRAAVTATLGMGLCLPAALWFFLAQRGSRPDQFPPFDLADALVRLARAQGGALFGGLPLYLDGSVRSLLIMGLGALLLIGVGCIVRMRPPLLPTLTALAPPAGLLLLGLVFNNTPIELRYLCFGLPFLALLLAAALPRPLAALFLLVQLAATIGLLHRPETMQPARAMAADLPPDSLVLVPRGNDGVGIVGAFAIEAPATTRLLLFDGPNLPPDSDRLILAPIEQDDASRRSVAAIRRTLADNCWRRVPKRSNYEVYQRCGGGHDHDGDP